MLHIVRTCWLATLCAFGAQVSPLHAQPSAPNRVLDLDGKDGSYVELPASAFTNQTLVTVEGWVKWESFQEASRVFDFALKDCLVDLRNAGTNPHLWSELFQSGICLSHQVPDVLRTGEWVHLALIVAPNASKLYFNRVDRTAAEPRRFAAGSGSSRDYPDGVAELTAAVGHSCRWASGVLNHSLALTRALGRHRVLQ